MLFFRILQFLVGGLFLSALAFFAVVTFGTGQGEVAQAQEGPAVERRDQLEEAILADRPEGEGLSFLENLIVTVTGKAITAVEDAEAEGVLDVATLNREHVVEIDQFVHLADLIPAGMMSPPEVDRDTFALAQVPRYLRERECPLLLEELAVACQVLSARVSAEEDNIYQVDAKIAFVAEAAPGDVPLVENLRTVAEWFDVYDGERPRGDRADQDAVRRLSYAQVVTQCAALRETYGNCVVEEVDVNFRRNDATPEAERVFVRVKVSAIVPGSDS
ncbi:hypothetical protein AB3Y40_10350 [Yoonia sp. R2331]|uniref:hypothetical protein n=1 Tax=Yoonia sp. R2331 TaxID=3237238 RepID=UPI0034E4AC5E